MFKYKLNGANVIHFHIAVIAINTMLVFQILSGIFHSVFQILKIHSVFPLFLLSGGGRAAAPVNAFMLPAFLIRSRRGFLIPAWLPAFPGRTLRKGKS